MGTARLFVFCIVFLTVQALILYMIESDLNPLYQYGNTVQLLDVSAPPAPNFNASPFAFIGNLAEAANYAVALTVYVIRLGVSLISFPFSIAAQLLIFNGKYPFLMIVNGSVILFLAYATITRIGGGGD